MKVEFNLRELEKIYNMLLKIEEQDKMEKKMFDKIGSILYPRITQ